MHILRIGSQWAVKVVAYPVIKQSVVKSVRRKFEGVSLFGEQQLTHITANVAIHCGR